MKKLLIGLLIALAVMVMLVFALNACDAVPTAQADMGIVLTNMSAPSGVVLPNSLGYDDFSGVRTTSFTVPSQFVGADEGLYAHNYTVNADSSVTVNGTFQNYFIVFDVVNNDNSYCVLSFSFTQPTNKVHTMRLWSLSTNSQILTRQFSSSPGNYFSLKPGNINDYSLLQLPTGKYVCYEEGSVNTSYTLYRIKLEKWDSSILYSTSCGFSGFVVPNYTYQLEPSPYNSWDGVVMPNLLNGADLFEYPYYASSSGFVEPPRDVYYSDAPTSCFSTVYGLSGLVDLPVCEISDSRNTADLLANEVTLKYRYTYQDLFPDILTYYNLTYTLCASGFNSCLISMETDHSSHSVDLTISGSDAAGFGAHHSLSLFDGAPVAFTYVDITVTFYSEAARDLSVYFYYSKLEAGDLFTGFVPLEHSDLTVVNYDLLPNFDFSSAPIHRLENGEFDIRANDVNWFITGLEYDDFTISFPVQGGLRVQCPSEYGYSLIYDFVPDEVGIANYMNFALKAFSNVAFTVEVYHYDDRDNTSNLLPIKSCYFLRSSTVHDISFSFPFVSDGVRIIIGIDGISDTTFYYSKLEYGDVFTGYCENSEIMYNRAYDAGYTDGSVDAIDQFSSSTYDWTFGVDGQWLRLDTGWADLGFVSGNDLPNGYFTLYPAFYSANGITIASSGYFVDSQNDVPYVVTVYASRYDVDNLELLDEYLNIFIVKIYENYSTLIAKDESFTPDYLVYDRNRTVTLNVTRGLDSFTDFYNNAIYNDGYQTGYVDGEDFGYVQGRARGYSEAVKYYQEIGSTGGWFGFISAFIDVPISVITNLLDWDFFGFNLLNIIKVLILFSLTFLVLRLITKGRAQV